MSLAGGSQGSPIFCEYRRENRKGGNDAKRQHRPEIADINSFAPDRGKQG